MIAGVAGGLTGGFGVPDGVFGVERVCCADGGAGDGQDGERVGIEDGVLEGEGGLGSALPEAGEEHREEACLGEEEHGPDAGLGEHVHGGAGGEDDGGGSEEGEEEEGEPGSGEVVTEGSEGRAEGAADAAVWFSVMPIVLAELDGVDLDQVEVEAEEGGHEEDEEVADEVVEEGREADDVAVDVSGEAAPEGEQRAEDDGKDEKADEGDADEAPEVEQALLEEGSEAGGGGGLVAEEGSGDEEEVDQEVGGDAGVACLEAGCSGGAFAEAEGGLGQGAEVEAADEALGGEGVVEEDGETVVQAYREEECESEVEDVGPEEGREAAEGQAKAVDEDASAFGHAYLSDI